MSKLEEYKKLYETPAGPGDVRPTASQIIEDEGLNGRLTDKTILITGSSSGLGLETARTLAKTGARIFMAVRNMEKGRAVLEKLQQDDPALDASRLTLLQLDNNSLDSVRKAAATFTAQSSQLNVLINNAGIAMSSFKLTQDGFEEQFGVNHLAHFLLFMLLQPLLLKSSSADFQSRVVNVSSGGHRHGSVRLDDYNFSEGYEPLASYAQSKTANIWMANEIERRYGSQGLHGLSVHPGGIMTGLVNSLAPEVRPMLEAAMQDPKMENSMKSVGQGSATTMLAAVGASFEGKGAIYLEDCAVGEPFDPDGHMVDPGYASWAFDEDGAKRLWADSLAFVGLE